LKYGSCPSDHCPKQQDEWRFPTLYSRVALCLTIAAILRTGNDHLIFGMKKQRLSEVEGCFLLYTAFEGQVGCN
jgi:hypothetical protein